MPAKGKNKPAERAPAPEFGRPKAGLETLPGDWQQQIIALYMDGASDVEIKALICGWRGSFSNDLWERWMQEEPDFSETIKSGKILAEAWFTRKGREHLQNPKFSFVGWYMQMKNRFGWKDKHEVETNHGLTEEAKHILFPDGTSIQL